MKTTEFLTSSIITIGLAIISLTGFGQDATGGAKSPDAIRPFHFHFSDKVLSDLRRRIAAIKWPGKETVTDAKQGVQLKTMRELAQYWQTTYNWRKIESRLNGYPQYITNIDGLNIHFIHVRSKNPNSLPLIITHGWPEPVGEFFRTPF